MSTLNAQPVGAPTPPEALPQTLNSGKCGMLCLIASEITFFGTLLAVYLFYIGKDPVGFKGAELIQVESNFVREIRGVLGGRPQTFHYA